MASLLVNHKRESQVFTLGISILDTAVYSLYRVMQKLKEDLKNEGRGDDVILSYIVCGHKGDKPEEVSEDDFVKVWRIVEVDEDEVEETEKSCFTVVTGRIVKSIRPKDLPERIKAEKKAIARPQDDWKETEAGEDFEETTITEDENSQSRRSPTKPEVVEVKKESKPTIIRSKNAEEKSFTNFFSKKTKNDVEETQLERHEEKEKPPSKTKPTIRTRKGESESEDGCFQDTRSESPVVVRKSSIKRRLSSEDDDLKENPDEDRKGEKETIKKAKKSLKLNDHEEDEDVIKKPRRKRIQMLADSDEDTNAKKKTVSSDSEDDETAIKIRKKKEKQEVEKERRKAIKEQERLDKLKDKEDAKMKKKIEKQKELDKKMNGRVKVKDDNKDHEPGHAVEIIDADEEKIDEDGFTSVKKVKRVIKRQLTEEEIETEKKEEPLQKTISSTHCKPQSNAGSKKGKAALAFASQKRITDFFSRK
jgi:hypothetical protein